MVGRFEQAKLMASANETASATPDEAAEADRAEPQSVTVSNKATVHAPGLRPPSTSASLPVSMVVRPASTSEGAREVRDQRFSGELEFNFDEALIQAADLASLSVEKKSAKKVRFRLAGSDFRREVGFDGYRRGAHDEKLERDRRYGTVYSISEGRKAYLVRLEMPRRLPASALRTAWERTGEMPDYKYTMALENNALIIKAGVPDESLRRLAYVSPSFPSDFLTRIEFGTPVIGFSHRMRDKVLEAVVFKEANSF
jgi:hypothetical protein